jgi:hypothetical protein
VTKERPISLKQKKSVSQKLEVGLITAWVYAWCAQRRRPAVALTKPFHLPERLIEVTEQQASIYCCPAGGFETKAEFPTGVAAVARYGERIKAAAIYLNVQQLIPEDRVAQTPLSIFTRGRAPGRTAGIDAKRTSHIGQRTLPKRARRPSHKSLCTPASFGDGSLPTVEAQPLTVRTRVRGGALPPPSNRTCPPPR